MKKNNLVIMGSILIVVVLLGLLFTNRETSTSNTDEKKSMYLSTEAGMLPEVDALNVQGDIIIAGSSTVYPLVEKLADDFKMEGYNGTIEISSIGSGAGFERWAMQGETDIATASREIKSKEVENAKAINRDPIPFQVGIDALVVVINKENTWLSDASVEQLARIFTSEKWSDLDPSWPSEDILKFSPGTDSGTFDYFVEEIFDKDKVAILNAPNVQLSEDDNILSRGVQGNKYAIGYFGYAYYLAEKENLKAVLVDNVMIKQETINNSQYPLARPLFMYTAKSVMQEKPQVAAFLAYTLNRVNSVITEVGYFPLDEMMLQKAIDNWLMAVEGIQE